MSDPIDPGREVPSPSPGEHPALASTDTRPPSPPATEPPAPPAPTDAPTPPPPPVSVPAAPVPWAPAQPVGTGQGRGWITACLLVAALIVFIGVAGIVALIFLGSQVSSMLSATGQALETNAPSHAVAATATPSGEASTPTPTLAATRSPAAPETEPPMPSGMSDLPHEAPDVEALAPRAVNGLPLTTWSVKGDGWLELAGLSSADSAALRQAIAEGGGSIDDCAQVISGRTSVEDDPPYFVYLYRVPAGAAAFEAILPLVIGTAGWRNGLEPDRFETATLGGKEVFVGTVDMLEQSEHQRGRPYWYEIDNQTLAIVITDQEAWAIDALRQLP